MSYDVIPLERFKRDVKQLSKKYRHIKEDLQELEALLSENPTAGDAIPELKGSFYKVRLRNTDLRKGKRAGYRVVYYPSEENETIFLVTLYVKGEKENIRPKDILAIMKQEKIGIQT
ncbi:MAG: type II toxin-antitoxin system RelE/ParE family toxin [Candidatus Latescibacteria bacterium]|nr:type II toxin-antitoxin system RelE/ParE family toxin [Candidatus Latescibacterota bacterium]